MGCPEIAVGSELRVAPQLHKPGYPRLAPPLPGFAVSFKQMQFLEALEHPVREIDFDAILVQHTFIEFIRQGFAPPG